MKKSFVIFFIFLIQLQYTQTPFYYPGYPKTLDTLRRSYGRASIPLITDLDKDGQKEIIVGACLPGSTCMLYVIKSDGSNQSGFPKLFSNYDYILGYASGDVDGDGYLDIALRLLHSIDVLDRFGNHLPGFPVPFIYGLPSATGFSFYVQLYDLDNDGKLEIIANKYRGIAVYNYNGIMRNGWPVSYPGESDLNTAIGDIDNDGFSEILATTARYPGVPPYVDSAALRIYRENGANYSNNFPVYFDSAYNSFFGGLSIYINRQNPTQNFILLYQSRTIYILDMQSRMTKYDVNGNIIVRKYYLMTGNPGPLSIGDINNDNMLDFAGGSQQEFSLFDSDLNRLPGFPVQREGTVNLTPCIGKLSANNRLNFTVSGGSISAGAGLWAGNYDATYLPWSPLGRDTVYPRKSVGFSLGDINNDGQVEIISTFDSSVNSYNSFHLHVWTVPGIPYNNSDFPWPTYGHDRYRTFQYGFIPPDEPIGVIPISNNIPVKFSLLQNYPNPFNPVTKIRFDIPSNVKRETSNVKLVVYDIIGREITTLVNEELKPGTYEINWNAGNYTSGIYFYKILTSEFSEAKKMILVK